MSESWRPFLRLWMIATTLIVTWDASYCLLRPKSFQGGSNFAWIWKPYELYGTIDYVYSREAYAAKDGWTNAQSTMNVVEICLQWIWLFLTSNGQTPQTDLLAFFVSSLTSSKTILYFLIDYWCGWCNSGHNGWWNFWVMYAGTNGWWIILPTLWVTLLGKSLWNRLGQVSLKKLK